MGNPVEVTSVLEMPNTGNPLGRRGLARSGSERRSFDLRMTPFWEGIARHAPRKRPGLLPPGTSA
jgi:hypothetical protein